MTLRRRFLFYLVLLHLLLSAGLVVLFWNHRVWVIAGEAVLILSIIAGVRLLRGLFEPVDALLAGTESLKDGDFSTRLRPTGRPEMDALIAVYNTMIDTLREERLTLQEQHYFLQKVIAASPAGIVTLDYDGKLALMNPAAEKLMQIRGDEMIGRRMVDLAAPLAGELNRLHAGESRMVTQGARRVRCVRSQFIDRGFPRDFFVLEELTEELRLSEKSAYEKLIRMMSHEVNNSIGAANSLLHSSLRYRDQLRAEDRDDFVSALSIAISRAEHLNEFMKSFADIVRLPSPVMQEVDLGELMGEICRLMEPECRKRSIDLRTELSMPAKAMVSVDRLQMEQVFVNILKNAMEAIGEKGEIRAKVEVNGRVIRATVEDSGGGIPLELRPLIFTPFFSTKENGRGIGLTLIQEILSQHRLEYSLDGPPGGPTRFTIVFPQKGKGGS